MSTVTPQIRTLPGPGIRGSHRLEQPQTCPVEGRSSGARRHPILVDGPAGFAPHGTEGGRGGLGEGGPSISPAYPRAPQSLDPEKSAGLWRKPSPGVSATLVGGVTRREGARRLWALGRVSGCRSHPPRLGSARPGAPGPVPPESRGAGRGR